MLLTSVNSYPNVEGMYASDYWEKVAMPSVKETLEVLHLSLIQVENSE